MPEPTFPMRINKYLAWKKHSTRRGADDLIKDKKVFVNGRPAVLGDKITEKDVVLIRFRGKEPTHIYIAYHKPIGILTHGAQGDETDIEDEIRQKIGIKGIFPVGRLDKDSHGLIILTNDGRITERLLGPEHEHEKVYVVKTKNILRASFKKKMEAGVKIETEQTKPCKVEVLSKNLFKVTLTEGKKHQIRRMCSALFQEVADLKRVKIMNIELGNLSPGSHREITGKELEKFLQLLDLA